MDASVRKEIPDSVARTIPLWCVSMNRIAQRYRIELGLSLVEEWDENLYTPEWLVSREEHATIEALADTRAQELYGSRAIADPHWLTTTLTKPLRPFWMTPQHKSSLESADELYFAIVCLNASDYHPNRKWMEKESFWYTSGAADDDEMWARQLSPRLFWDNVQFLLNDVPVTDDNADMAIDALVEQERQEHGIEEANDALLQDNFDFIGNTDIEIGTRRAGRPPAF